MCVEYVVSGSSEKAVVSAGDYLNKFTAESVERECKQQLENGCSELVVDFSRTEMVNSIGVSILLGIIDSASTRGTKVVFADVNDGTRELFDMLGVTRHVVLK